MEHLLTHISEKMELDDEVRTLFGQISDRELRLAIHGYKECLAKNGIHPTETSMFLRFTSHYFINRAKPSNELRV